MKKTLLFVASALFAGASFSQAYFANDAAAFGSWTTYDLDADGNNWGTSDMAGFGSSIDGQGECLASSSWDGTDALTPDNLAVSPAIDLSAYSSATLIMAWGSPETTDGGFHEEHIAVYAVTTAELAGLATGTFPSPIFEMTNVEGDVMHMETLDISAVAGGDAYIAVRHYNCTDENFVIIDDVEIFGSAASIDENGISVSVYPNPTVDALNMTFGQVAEQLNIYSLDGKLLLTQAITGNKVSVDVANLAAGTYIYEVTSATASTRNTFVKK